MAHDWGVSVPADMPTGEVMEILDRLRAGTITINLPDCVQNHEKAAQWRHEINTQLLAAYELEAARRRS